MKNENKLAPNTMTNSTPQMATVFSIERVKSANDKPAAREAEHDGAEGADRGRPRSG